MVAFHERLNNGRCLLAGMCESSVFLEDDSGVHKVMEDVARIVMEGSDAVCTDILGEKKVLERVKLKEANLLSHGIVFVRD